MPLAGINSPADPRPDGPVFVPKACECGVLLVCVDLAAGVPTEDAWHDEWECPVCKDGIVLDVPKSWWRRIRRR